MLIHSFHFSPSLDLMIISSNSCDSLISKLRYNDHNNHNFSFQGLFQRGAVPLPVHPHHAE